MVALAVRLMVFDRYLPMLDYSDESNMFLFSQDMRPEGAPLADEYGAALTGEWLRGYPPLYGWLGAWMQRGLELARDDFLFPGDYIGAMRALSVTAGTLTVAVMLALGYRVGGAWVGWFAALPVAFNPLLVDIGVLAIPDSLIPLATALALWGAAEAVVRERPAWLMVSVLGAIAAIYLKYSLLFALWPFAIGVALLIHRTGWRRMMPMLAALMVVSALTAGYLLWGYGALGLDNQEAAGFREYGLANLFDLDRNRVNLAVALDVSIGGVWVIGATLVGVLATLRADERDPRRAWAWLVVWVPFIIGNVMLTSSVVYADPVRGGYGRVRYLFPAGQAFGLWAALGVGLMLAQVRRGALWGGLLTVALVGPFVVADVGLVRQYARTDSNLLVWRYTDASLPNDGLILTPRESRTHKIWNRPYSGYDGATPFAWTHDENPARGTPSDAAAAGIAYLVHTESDRAGAYSGDDMAAFLDALFPLKTIHADRDDISGETTHIYRLLPPQVMTDGVRFGDAVRLVGYDMSATTVTAGESLTFRPYWSADSVPAAGLSLFAHLYPVGEPSAIVAQWDGPPAKASRPTVTWDDPHEQLIGSDVTLTLSDDIPDGDYTLAIGLYDYQSGARLSVGDSDRYTLTVTVE